MESQPRDVPDIYLYGASEFLGERPHVKGYVRGQLEERGATIWTAVIYDQTKGD
jgi:hypothetical protein